MNISTPMNKTLGLHAWNLPANKTCPGKSPWCERKCYARKGNFTFHSVKAAHQRALEQTKNPEWEDHMVTHVASLGVSKFRWHSSGDAYSKEYFRSLLNIARRLPNVQFLMFTKNWRVDGWLETLAESLHVGNFHLWFSADPSTEDPAYLWDKVAYATEDYSSCQKQTIGINCRECGKCFKKQTKKVYFKKH